MKRQLITVLTIGLFACGGSRPGDSIPPAEPEGAETGEAETGEAETGEAETGEAEADGDNIPTTKRGRKPSDAGEFKINEADESSRPEQTKLRATESEAALRLFVVDKDKGPIKGIVILLTAPTGKKYYTRETDTEGFAEVLVPTGQTYDLVYLSLGRRNVAAKVEVANEPNLNLKLTMRYKREEYPTGDGLVLGDVQFATGKATLTSASYARLDAVVEYMTHKESVRVEIAGHTDNVGNKKANKRLSQKRANAVRAYLVAEGIDASRIKAVGYGDQKPIAPNDTDEGRQRNRRIEATEI